MIQSFTIPHRLPGLNDFAGNRSRWHYAKVKKTTEASIILAIQQAGIKPMPYAYLSFVWFEENKRRDLDNIASATKFINDSLVAAKILPGDGWAHVLSLSHQFVCVNGVPSSVQVTLRTKDEVRRND